MATKAKDNTGFRNGNLFCFNCGTSQAMPLPMEAKLAGDFMMLFSKHHRKCLKTWEPPHPSETKNMTTLKEKMDWWIEKGEHGISSKTMFSVLGKFSPRMLLRNEYGHPFDPDDFRRCWLLLQAIPEFNSELSLMKDVSPSWKALVDNWNKLTDLLIEGMKINNGEKMMDFMQSILPK